MLEPPVVVPVVVLVDPELVEVEPELEFGSVVVSEVVFVAWGSS